MELHFEAIAEASAGERWGAAFVRFWPSYRKWFLSEGEAARPSWLECERALRRHMPELVPRWEELSEIAGGGDLESRFLSLYCPPPYLAGCSQAVWLRGEPLLVRNYDYVARLCDRLFLRSEWNGRPVVAATDCLIGVLDGINDAGLTVSLSFGGRREVGKGFGAPIVLRYLLEQCSTTPEAAAALRRIPLHMAYNVLVLDGNGRHVTAFTTPDGPTLLRYTPASTNHQDRVVWARHARATATLERERRLFQLLDDRRQTAESFVASFLEPPLHNPDHVRGFGTIYTAAYAPGRRAAEFLWPDVRWELGLDRFEEGSRTVPGANGDGSGDEG